MYRITYLYTGPAFDGFIPGERREVTFATGFAYVAYEHWRRQPLAHDVTLELFDNGAWRVIKGAESEAAA